MFGFNFKSLRDTVQSVEQKLEGMRAEINELRRQREMVLSAPASKDDLKAMLNNWVASSGDNYRKSLRETLAKFVRNPRNMTPQDLARVMSISGMAQPYGEEILRTQDVDQALCALFGPLLNRALLDEIENMEWAPNAMTNADRNQEATRLAERIEQVERDISNLMAAAEEAGITWSR